MIFAFLTTLLWSASAVTARRLVEALGSLTANLARLAVASALLAAWAFTAGRGLEGAGLWWFVASGVVGFGLGDVALYFALARLGSRLTILLTQTLAAPIGALVEWLWLGTTLSAAELACGAGVLGGVALALVPSDNPHVAPGSLRRGLGWGVLAAMGQGLGAVLSRKAFDLSMAGGVRIDGATAAFQRILGGLAVGWLAWLLWSSRPGERRPAAAAPSAAPLRGWRLMALLLAVALFGPVVGVACYQWALASAPSGVVLPVVALCPVVIIPFSARFEGDRPKARSLWGAGLAVASAIALAAVRR
jgi:drug/metabolite transporter (DMT)-like permease